MNEAEEIRKPERGLIAAVLRRDPDLLNGIPADDLSVIHRSAIWSASGDGEI
jgi:hypothetical protein